MDNHELENLHNIIAHDGRVDMVKLNRDTSEQFASTGQDFLINLWSVGSNKPKYTLGPFKTKITAMEFSHKENLIICGNTEGTVMIFDIKDSRCLNQWIAHKSAVTALCPHPSNHSIVLSGGADGKFLLLSTQMRRPLQVFSAHKGTINHIAISSDGRYAATAGIDKTVKVFDLTSTRQIAKFDSFQNSVLTVEFHATRQLIAAGCSDNSLHFFDIQKGEEIKSEEIPLDSSPIEIIRFQSEDGLIFSASKDYLKTVTWEPAKLHDYMALGFDKIDDISIKDYIMTIASSSGDRILIDRVRKDSFKPYIFANVGVHAIGKGEIERSTQVKTPRLLDLDQIRPASVEKSRKISTASSSRSNSTTSTLKSEETGIFHFNISKKKKVKNMTYEIYKDGRTDSMQMLTSKYSRLCSINDMLTSTSLEELIAKILNMREDLAVDFLGIIRLKVDCLTMKTAPQVIRIAALAFIENAEVAVSAVEVVLQMFGAQYLDDEENADEMKSALASIQPMLNKAKNSNEDYADIANQILSEYYNLFM